MNKNPVRNVIRPFLERLKTKVLSNWFLKLVALVVTVILFYLAHLDLSPR